MKFSKPQPDVHFPSLEKTVLSHWKTHSLFQRSVTERSKKNRWNFYDGPPFATGLPHHGHLLQGIVKDVIPRYWTMRGKHVERRFGWDCHGLPVEFELEKNLNLSGPKDIRNYGVDRFNEACRSIVQRYTEEWKQTVARSGRWVDMENVYRTMDPPFMESVWAVFKKLWDRGFIYEDKKVLPYSARIATPLSNFEANLNYKDVQDPSITVSFQSVDDPSVYFLVWTTTPWTLPANLGIAVHPEFQYSLVEVLASKKRYWIHAQLLHNYFKDSSTFSIVKSVKGVELKGLRYRPLIPCFPNFSSPQAHQILADAYVSDADGTGMVHQAPAFGEDDYRVCKSVGIPPLDHTDEEGRITHECPLFQGKNFKDADKDIITYLKDKGLLFLQSTIQHSYPFCWRSETPLMYKAISTWFVKVTAFKDQLLQNNQKIHWVPEHLKDGRFGKWLENARDWAISRNRFWGNPIPVWRSESGDEVLCLGSMSELQTLSGKKVSDLHKHFIDGITIKSPKSGQTLHRIPEIFDCWFESGAMPYAEHHYPFSISEDEFNQIFPADFIAEGLDQTRGWFYTLSVLSAGLGRGPAFKNVVVTGLILAEDGKKMSKSLKNYPDPNYILDEYGADALRIYLLQSGAVSGEPLNFSERGLKEMTRKVLLPLWNAYSFFATYAEVDGWDPSKSSIANSDNPLDQWILIKLNALKQLINQEMELYHLPKTVPPLLDFIDDLTNWYIRRSRRRFWKSENDTDKLKAYSTLYQVLVDLTKIAAPFIPFITDFIFQKLTGRVSVHLESFPEEKPSTELQQQLVSAMDTARQVVFLGRELREKLKIKTRQPISKLVIGLVDPDASQALKEMDAIIREELNVKSVAYLPFQDMASWVMKPNFKLLGQRLGPRLKEFQTALQNVPTSDVFRLLKGEELRLIGETFSADSFLIQLVPKQGFQLPTHASGSLIVAMDPTLTESLIAEGLAREVINRVQKFRKDLELNVADRIELFFVTDRSTQTHLELFLDTVEQETLSKIKFQAPPLSVQSREEDLEDAKISIGIQKTNR